MSLLYDKLSIPVEGSDEYDDTHADLCATIFTPSVVRQLPFLLKACAQWVGISNIHSTHNNSTEANLQSPLDSPTANTSNTYTTANTASLVVALAFGDIVKSIYDTSITTIDILHLWWDILNKYAFSSSHIEGKQGGENYDLSLSEHITEVYNCVSCDWLDPTVVHGAYPLKSTVPILPVPVVEEENDKMDITHNYGDLKGIKSELVTDSIKPLVIKLKHTTPTASDEGHNSHPPSLPLLPVVPADIPPTTTTSTVSATPAPTASPAAAPPRKFKSLKLSLKTSDNIVTTTTALRYTTTTSSDTIHSDTTALDTNDNGKRYTTRGYRLSAEFLRRAVDADIHDIHDAVPELMPNSNATDTSNSSDVLKDDSDALLSPEEEDANGISTAAYTDSYNSNSIVRQPSKKSILDTKIQYDEINSEEGNDDEEEAYDNNIIDEVESEEEEEYYEEDEFMVKGRRRHTSTNKKSSSNSSHSSKKRKATQDSSSPPSAATVTKPTSTTTYTTKKGHKSGGSSSSIRQNIMKILTSKKKIIIIMIQ